MDADAYLISISAGAFYLIAGFRLLRLSHRTQEIPERFLGLYLFLAGIYYFGYNLPNLVGFDSWSPAALWLMEWTYILGMIPCVFFIREVFRPGETWATALAWFCVTLMLMGTGIANLGDHADFTLHNPWFAVQWIGYTLPSIWLFYEATRTHRTAKKRVEIGLCEPLTANRYRLIALFGGFQFLACLAYLAYAADIESNRAISLISDCLLGGTEFSSAAILWLAFFPPRFYKNWVSKGAGFDPTPAQT